jgi:hypothetical protein
MPGAWVPDAKHDLRMRAAFEPPVNESTATVVPISPQRSARHLRRRRGHSSGAKAA